MLFTDLNISSFYTSFQGEFWTVLQLNNLGQKLGFETAEFLRGGQSPAKPTINDANMNI